MTLVLSLSHKSLGINEYFSYKSGIAPLLECGSDEASSNLGLRENISQTP
jgi:hypothetical protein